MNFTPYHAYSFSFAATDNFFYYAVVSRICDGYILGRTNEVEDYSEAAFQSFANAQASNDAWVLCTYPFSKLGGIWQADIPKPSVPTGTDVMILVYRAADSDQGPRPDDLLRRAVPLTGWNISPVGSGVSISGEDVVIK